MAHRARLGAFALAMLAACSLVWADDRPPANLHLVGDHWTAWNPPETLPPDAKVHIVVRGDTFWDLSQQNLGNPYLWPQIWERNQYVLDAHWIYPGDPLVIGVSVAPAETVGAMETEEMPAAATAAPAESEAAATGPAKRRVSALEARRNAPAPLGSEDDIYCSGFIGPLDQGFAWSIIGSEYETVTPHLASIEVWSNASGLYGRAGTDKYELSPGDIVYVDGGRAAGLSPGMLLTAVDVGDRVRHPVTRDVLGRFYAYSGRVRVLTVQDDRAIAEIVQGCSGVHVGSRLMPFEPEPVPLARWPQSRPVNDPTVADLSSAPAIVHTESDLFTVGQDSVVFIDRGESDDVYPGDLFTIYSVSENGLPPVPVGELAVLSVRERSAVGKILESRYPIHMGDRLERR